MIDQFARRLGYEKRGATDLILTSLQAQVADGVVIIGALEVAAGIIGRALASATVTGAGAANFDAETLLNIGRRLIVAGEYAGLITPPHPLTMLFDFELVSGVYGATGGGGQIRYDAADGKTVTTSDAIHVRYSLAEDGHGAGILQNARGLYKIAHHLERILQEELSGLVGAVMPLPSVKNIEALKAAIRELKGKTTFAETTQQTGVAGIQQPKNDFEQIKIAPRIPPEWLSACDMTERTVYRAAGIPLTMLSENQSPSREALRVFQTNTIEPLAKLIEQAAKKRGIAVDLKFADATRFDAAGRARAWGILVAGGFDDELASEYLGFPLE